MKALRLTVSEKKNFEPFLLFSYVLNCDLRCLDSFDPRATNKLGRGAVGDAT